MNEYKKVFGTSPVLFVDAGNFAAVGIAGAEARNDGMIAGLNRIGYAAVMLGERELAAGYESFRAMEAKAEFPFVSANFIFEDTGETLVDPFTIMTLDQGSRQIKVAFLGLNRYNTGFIKGTDDGRNVVVSSPFQAARRLVPEIRDEVDVLVLLTSLSISQARQLATEVEGIDLIVGANGGVLSLENDQSGGVPIVYPGNQGKYLAEVRMFVGEGGGLDRVRRRNHYLNRDYPADPELQAMVNTALARENDINRQRARADAPRVPIPAGVASFQGAEVCAACHEDVMASWHESPHAGAFQTLIDRNADFNDECVPCHVVGFGRAGGFLNAKASPDLIDVQCEACHGPGSRHVDDPSVAYGTAGARSCLGCHDPEHSPGFDFYSFWPKIKH